MKHLLIILIVTILISCKENPALEMVSSIEVKHKYLNYIEDSANFYDGSLIHDRGTMPTNEIDLITYTMLGIGYYNLHEGQTDTKRYKIGLEKALDSLLSDNVKQVSLDSWEYDPLDKFVVDDQHGLYLGYLNIVLSLHQKLYGKSKYSDLNDKISDILYLKLKARNWKLSSYSVRDFFPDNMTMYASSAVNFKIRGKQTEYEELIKQAEKWYIIERDLLFSEYGPQYGTGSSYVVYSLYMMSFFVPSKFILTQTRFIDTNASKKKLGYYGIVEYPYAMDVPDLTYDRDAGPIVYNIGTTGTGYMLALCKYCNLEDSFQNYFETARLVGGLLHTKNSFYFMNAGYPENAIMFGILTSNKNFIDL